MFSSRAYHMTFVLNVSIDVSFRAGRVTAVACNLPVTGRKVLL